MTASRRGLTFVLTVGCLALIGAALLYGRERTFVRTAERAEGRIVELEYRADDDGGSYFPAFRFRTADGRRVTVHTNVGANPPAWEVGQAVNVLYDPERPESARIATFFHLYLGSFITAMVASTFLVAGLLWFLVAGRELAAAGNLRYTGRRITADVVRAVPVSHLFTRKKEWRLIARGVHPATGREQTFLSLPLEEDPTPRLPDGKVTVFVDEKRVMRYLVDVEA